jgi:hypothetical protein
MVATAAEIKSAPAVGTEKPIPFKMWWGLLGCAIAMGLMFALAPYSADLEFKPDKPLDFWYYWQRQDATLLTRVSAWIPYILHQVSIWFLIYHARQAKPAYIWGLHKFNVWALGINAAFIGVHLLQTKLFYDGLAQDVHEATSMMSVILMLLMILVMENKRRGLFFGKGVKAMYGVGDTLKRYHGYYFSWAIIYTFWYHPFEMTSGHIAGFAYMFLLLLQSSLFFTRYHTNRWWTMSLETLFVVHGAIVAAYIMNPGQHEFWSMFLFGGVATFLITQMHGLGLSMRQKWIVTALLVIPAIVVYMFIPETLIALPRLPAIMYLGSFLCFIILLGMRLLLRLTHRSVPAPTS